jgi:hypothetical protein
MKRVISLAAMFSFVSCGTKSSVQEDKQGLSSVYASQPYNFRLNLTDAPNDALKSVYVNVKYAELRLSGGGKEARLIVAKNLGQVDLLKLQDGVTLPMADLNLPEAVTVTQIRLVLAAENNYLIKSDESRCDLRTPSEQQTGIKFLIHDGVTIEKGYSYSIVADFDAKKSIVLMGNGGCLLKPVLKLKSASRIELPSGDGDGIGGGGSGGEPSLTPTPAPEPNPTPLPTSTPIPEVPPGGDDGDVLEEEIASEGDSSQVGDESGFDFGDDVSVPVIQPDNLNTYF